MLYGKNKRGINNSIKLAITGFILLFSFVLSPIPSQVAFAAPGDTGGTVADENNDTTDTGTNCAIEKIGWMLCPVIEGAAKLGDYAFRFLANNFLAVEPELLSVKAQDGGEGGTLVAWGQARNLANIMFVIAFVIIIYSQITGSGLNNYGIKRMMPRLILAAIAVNVSYYICQALVDLSNILGYNIMEAMQKIASDIGPQVMGADVSQGINTTTTSDGGILATVALAALPIAGLIWLMLPVLGGVVFFIVITCITIILILLLRKAFIVLLVVVSPLAFVMYLLPNTEKYFSKWLDMFWKLLLVFPIVALLMGGGQLASTIILVAGSQDTSGQGEPAQCDTSGANAAEASSKSIKTDSYGIEGECPITIGNKQSSMTLGLVAAGIAVAPLLAVWSVLQGALAAAGAIGGKIGGVVNNMQNRQSKKFGKSMAENGEYRRNQMNAAALSGDSRLGKAINTASLGSARRDARRRAKGNYAKSALNNEDTAYIARSAIQKKDDGTSELTSFGNSLAGGVFGSKQRQEKVLSNAQNAQSALQNEEVKAATVRAEGMENLTLQAELTGDKDSPQVAAAISELAKRQDFDGLREAIKNFGKSGNSLASRTLGASLSQNNPGFLTAGDIGQISRGGMSGSDSYAAMADRNIAAGALSPEKMAETGPSALAEAGRLATSQEAKQALINSAHAAANDDVLKQKIGRNATQINNFRAGRNANGDPF